MRLKTWLVKDPYRVKIMPPVQLVVMTVDLRFMPVASRCPKASGKRIRILIHRSCFFCGQLIEFKSPWVPFAVRNPLGDFNQALYIFIVRLRISKIIPEPEVKGAGDDLQGAFEMGVHGCSWIVLAPFGDLLNERLCQIWRFCAAAEKLSASTTATKFSIWRSVVASSPTSNICINRCPFELTSQGVKRLKLPK